MPWNLKVKVSSPPSYCSHVGLTKSLLADDGVARLTGFTLASFVDSLDPERVLLLLL